MDIGGGQFPIVGEPIELDTSHKRRFYPGLLLCSSIQDFLAHRRKRRTERVFKSGVDLDEDLKEFLCKLALICHTDAGGDCVSACVALNNIEGGVQYVFASNQRTEQELNHVQEQVECILEMVGGISLESSGTQADKETHERILHAILQLNKHHIRVYISNLRDRLQECLQDLTRETDSDVPNLEKHLTDLHLATCQVVPVWENGRDSSLPFDAELVEPILVLLHVGRQGAIQESIERRLLKESAQPSDKCCWHEVAHIASRLLSYLQAVKSFLHMRRSRPELFRAFEITFVQSSKPMGQPLKQNPWTAEGIIRRFAGVVETRDSLINGMKEWRAIDIDAHVAMKWQASHKSLHPVVHAEVLLHDWLENTDGGVREDRFFGNCRFIGTSKPPCQVCAYFFTEWGTSVKIQPTHGNLYTAWRMPDIYKYQGNEAVEKRKRVLEAIRGKLCADLKRTVEERQGKGRPHDSTSSYFMRLGMQSRRDVRTPWTSVSEAGEINGGLTLFFNRMDAGEKARWNQMVRNITARANE